MALVAPTQQVNILNDQLLQHIQTTILQLLDKKKGARNSQGQRPPGQGHNREWHYTAPKDPQETVPHNNTIFHWCLKCNNGRGQWVSAHTTDSHIDGFLSEQCNRDSNKANNPKHNNRSPP